MGLFAENLNSQSLRYFANICKIVKMTDIYMMKNKTPLLCGRWGLGSQDISPPLRVTLYYFYRIF